MANSAGLRLHSLLAIGHSLPSRTSDTIEFRLAHRAGRLQEAAATSDGHSSWFFRILLSDIVKRKHIRSKDWSWNELRAVARRARPTSLFGSGPLEHLSRGPRLTARLPDVFEAKLVFSTERALPSALSVYAEGRIRGDREIAARSPLLGYENNQVS